MLWLRRRPSATRQIPPFGWLGLAKQLAIWAPFLLGYEVSHGLVTGARRVALSHAHSVVDAERSLGIFHELDVQRWAYGAPDFVLAVAKFTYFQCQFTFTFAFVLWVYLFRPHAYQFLRNALLATFFGALPGYVLYPTAPPRMLPSLGFVDPLTGSALGPKNALIELLANPYAAMPSLHTATALLVGVWGVVITRSITTRVLFALYPALVVFSIVATANHFFLDAVAGAVLVSLTTAGTLAFFRRSGTPIIEPPGLSREALHRCSPPARRVPRAASRDASRLVEARLFAQAAWSRPTTIRLMMQTLRSRLMRGRGSASLSE